MLILVSAPVRVLLQGPHDGWAFESAQAIVVYDAKEPSQTLNYSPNTLHAEGKHSEARTRRSAGLFGDSGCCTSQTLCATSRAEEHLGFLICSGDYVLR